MWFLSNCTFYTNQATACFLSTRVVPDILHSYSDQATVCFYVLTCGSCHITHFIQTRPQFASCRHVWFPTYYTLIRIRPRFVFCRHVRFLSYYTFYSNQATVCFLSSCVVPDIVHSYSDQATVCFLSSREVPVILHILFISGHGLFLVFTCGSCHTTDFIQIRPHIVSCRHVWFLPNYTCYPDHCLFSCCHVSLAVTLTFFECDEQVVYLTSSLIIKVL